MTTILVPVDKDKAQKLLSELLTGAGRLENEGWDSDAVYEIAGDLENAMIANGIEIAND